MAFDAIETGGLIGCVIGMAFWAITFTGVERRFVGASGSGGLMLLIGLCLWFDGWIAVAIVAFCVTLSGLLALGGGGRGPRRAAERARGRRRPWRLATSETRA
ncbi:MAG: hypothetical protein ACJA1L_000695 [Paracoccaceae bacterium]